MELASFLIRAVFRSASTVKGHYGSESVAQWAPSRANPAFPLLTAPPLQTGVCHRQRVSTHCPDGPEMRERKAMSNDGLFSDADVIFAYTRADALNDGVLIELPSAKNWGFKVSVAITAGAYAECIAWGEPDPKLGEILRLREDMVLTCAMREARAHQRRMKAGKKERPDRIDFNVETIVQRDGLAELRNVELYMVIGPGDQGEPAGTIMLIGED